MIDALKENIPNSEGMVKYLELCSKVTSCFLETDLKPLERISRMWYAVFFLRIWRQFILSSKYDLQNSFISSNAYTYTCIEINARNLIVLIKRFRDRNEKEIFLPAMFDSQTCEKTFRLFRSMGTMEYTKINFTLYFICYI